MRKKEIGKLKPTRTGSFVIGAIFEGATNRGADQQTDEPMATLFFGDVPDVVK